MFLIMYFSSWRLENNQVPLIFNFCKQKTTKNGVTHLLPDPRDDGEVLREVCGEDPGDAGGVEVLQLGQLVAVEALLKNVLRKGRGGGRGDEYANPK